MTQGSKGPIAEERGLNVQSECARQKAGLRCRRPNGATVVVTLDEATSALDATRKRAEGWRTGSASLVAMIVASLALRPGTGWVTVFSGPKLYVLTGLIAFSLVLAMASMWFTLRAANGPFSLDAKICDYRRPHDVPRIFNRATSAAFELKVGQGLLWFGVLVFAITVFATWLLDPADAGLRLR